MLGLLVIKKKKEGVYEGPAQRAEGGRGAEFGGGGGGT